ncbi:MAG: FkbM family methyltransferase, partial [Bacteroidota bacterium]
MIKNSIKKILSAFDLKLSRVSSFEQETAFEAQERLLKQLGSEPFTIFDVGAYIGTVALQYNDVFPNATIFCFEPFPPSFSQLQINTAAYSNIKVIPKALGQETGRTQIHSNHQSSTNSLLASHERSGIIWGDNLLNTKELLEID